jgi:hypothetical protein
MVAGRITKTEKLVQESSEYVALDLQISDTNGCTRTAAYSAADRSAEKTTGAALVVVEKRGSRDHSFKNQTGE